MGHGQAEVSELLPVTWGTVEAVLGRHGAKPQHQSGRYRTWFVRTQQRDGTGGFTVEATLRPRWCSVAVDRWKTGDRDEVRSDPWFKENVWPLVREACTARRRGLGILPSGHTFSAAGPIERSSLLHILDEWVGKELEWGRE